MAGSAQIDWGLLGGKKQEPKPPVTPAPVQTKATSQPQAIDWGMLGGKKSSSPTATPAAAASTPQVDWGLLGAKKTAQPQERENDQGVFLRSVFKTASGKSASDIYDKFTSSGVVPKQYQGKWLTDFALELGRGGPEVVDAMTSPAGMSLIAAHLFPATRPVALVADQALAVVQGVRTIPDLYNLGHDFTAKNAAIAVKDLMFTYGMMKGASEGFKELSGGESNMAKGRAAVSKLEELKSKKSDKPAVAKAKSSQQRQIWDELWNPTKASDKIVKKAFESPISGVAKMVLPKPAAMEAGASLVEDYESGIASKKYATDRFLYGMKKEVPAEDLAVDKMGYVIQGAKSAKDVGLSPKAEEWVENYRRWNTEVAEGVKKDHGDIPVTLQDPRAYLSQMWDFDATAKKFAEIEELSSRGHKPEEIGLKYGMKPKAVERVLEQGVPQSWGDKKWFSQAGNRMMRDPFFKPRSAFKVDAKGNMGTGPLNYLDAKENFGWEPKFKTIDKIIEARMEYLAKTSELQKFARRLNDIGGTVGESKGRRIGIDWPKAVEAPALERAAYRGKKVRSAVDPKTGNTSSVTTVTTQKTPVFVHPALEDAVNTMFAKGYETRKDLGGGRSRLTPFGALEAARAWTKQTLTMTSGFHNWAEQSEAMAIQTGQARPGKALKTIFVLDPKFWKNAWSGGWESFGKKPPLTGESDPIPVVARPELAQDAIKHGLSTTSTDREAVVVKSLADFQAKNKVTKALSPVMRAFGNVASAFNKALWDYYIPNQQLNAYQSILLRELPRLGSDATPERVSLLKREITRHVNRQFGTESMRSLLLHPKTQQLLNHLVFAPVWTLSNIRSITAGYESATQQRLRNKWIVGAGISWFLSTQLLNYATTSWFSRDRDGKHDWKGHFTWDNPGAPLDLFGKSATGLSENATGIYVGPNKNGSQGYVRLGKGMAESLMWMLHPLDTAKGKIATIPREVITRVTGRAPGSDYQVYAPSDKPDETTVKTVGQILGATTPFWTQNFVRFLERKVAPEAVPESTGGQLLGLPVTQGLTVTRATEAYRMAKDRGDRKAMAAVLEAAKINGLKVDSIIANVKREESQRKRTEKGPREQLNWKQRMGFEPTHKTSAPPQLGQ